ncbi:GNAT family N-acetyltransferase, partial [Enterocloster sp.]
GDGVLELKNIAVEPVCQKKGYGRRLIRFICQKYKNQFHTLQAGTGDSPLTVPFYEHCGFIRGSVIPHFFMDHYDHPIYEGGKQLDDMIYFQLKL